MVLTSILGLSEHLNLRLLVLWSGRVVLTCTCSLLLLGQYSVCCPPLAASAELHDRQGSNSTNYFVLRTCKRTNKQHSQADMSASNPSPPRPLPHVASYIVLSWCLNMNMAQPPEFRHHPATRASKWNKQQSAGPIASGCDDPVQQSADTAQSSTITTTISPSHQRKASPV